MLSPVFTFELNQSILHGLATIGRCNFKSVTQDSQCLAAATTGGKIMIYNPKHSQSQLNYLNINKTITCLESGWLGETNDTLLIGSPTNIQAYSNFQLDIDQNQDLFNCEVRDGVMSLAIGPVTVNGSLINVALVGGNCSILGFNNKGEDVFWTVSGDNVSALAFAYIEHDPPEILAGSEDYAIRVFNNEELISEINEAAKVTNFAQTRKERFAYSLDNGTVGLYHKSHRVWRIKTRHQALSLATVDLEGTGVNDVVIGWSNGRLEVRSEIKGKTVFKKMLKEPIAKVIKTDFRMEGQDQIIACTTSGKIFGYMPQKKQPIQQSQGYSADIIEELTAKKNSLMNEIAHYKNQGTSQIAQVDVQLGFQQNLQDNMTELAIQCSQGVIRTVIIFADGLFEGDSYIADQERPSNICYVPLPNPKSIKSEVELKILIGQSSASTTFQVVEKNITLPRFSDLLFNPNFNSQPSGQVNFEVPDIQSFYRWLGQSFIIPPQSLQQPQLGFKGPSDVLLVIQQNLIVIRTNSLDIASQLIQDICKFCQIQNLESRADFPETFQQLVTLAEQVTQFNNARQQLSVNMAESVQIVKALIVKSEDSRFQHSMQHFKRYMSRLQQFNGELLGEHQKLANNHQQLMEFVKQVNQIIQRAGGLRFGAAQIRVVSGCREAFKQKNLEKMITLIQNGHV